LRNRLQRLRAKIIRAGAKARLDLQAGDIELLGEAGKERVKEILET